MKRTRKLLVVGLAALLMAVSAAPASAERREKGPPDQPVSGPTGGYTCEEVGKLPFATYGPDDFTVVLDAGTPSVCLDVWSDHSGVWKVTVGGSGARGLDLYLRDSFSPGDACAVLNLGRDDLYGVHTLREPGTEDPAEVPPSTVNACGTTYGEWIDESLVMEQPSEAHPLAVVAYLKTMGKAGKASIEFELPAGP